MEAVIEMERLSLLDTGGPPVTALLPRQHTQTHLAMSPRRPITEHGRSSDRRQGGAQLLHGRERPQVQPDDRHGATGAPAGRPHRLGIDAEDPKDKRDGDIPRTD